MKNLLSLAMLLTILGCGPSSSKPKSNLSLHVEDDASSPTKTSSEDASKDTRRSVLEIAFGGTKLLVAINAIGDVTILNYPNDWEGNAKLLRYEGQMPEEGAFSSNHCARIRNIASNPYSKSLVRNSFQSLISFEIPAFLSSHLLAKIRDTATAAGISFPAFHLKNPLDGIGKLELTLSNKAISNLLGNIGVLKEQLHLDQKGIETNGLEKEVTIYSGDIICDLISGDAEMSMTYPIKGEKRVLKVIYKPLKISLSPT